MSTPIVNITTVGSTLRRERELRGVSLEEVAQTTRIPMVMLLALEADEYPKLPGEVFVRGFLQSYAKTLGLDPRPLVARYRAMNSAAAPAKISAIAPPEKGRRFGVALALVVLLILFTLALSIVLRPRHRDLPVELSEAPSLVDDARVADGLPCARHLATRDA